MKRKFLATQFIFSFPSKEENCNHFEGYQSFLFLFWNQTNMTYFLIGGGEVLSTVGSLQGSPRRPR